MVPPKVIRKENNQCSLNVTLNKRFKMLKRRLHRQQEIMLSLEKRNIELSTDCNETKMSLSQVKEEYHKLMATNYELTVQVNHKQEELERTKAFVANEVMSALRHTGNLSEILLNLQNFLTVQRTSNHPRVEVPPVLTTPSLRNRSEIFPGSSNEVKRVQAAVSPMIKGIALKHPTIALRRLNPDEISAYRGESPVNVCAMSPIQEDPSTPAPRSEPIRTRLGSRNQQIPAVSLREASIIRDLIPEAHSEPVVRLSDVSRLLSNTSWVNYSTATPNTNTDNLLKDNGSAPSSSSETCSSSEIPVTNLGTITVRKRKKHLMFPSNNHDNKLETEVQMIDSSVVQMLDSSEVQTTISSEVPMVASSSSSSFVADEQVKDVKNFLQVSSFAQLYDNDMNSPRNPSLVENVIVNDLNTELPNEEPQSRDEDVLQQPSTSGYTYNGIKSTRTSSTEKSSVVENTIVNELSTELPNERPQNQDEDVLQQPSTSANTSNEYGRPKSKRSKKPSVRYLDASESVPKRSPKESVKPKRGRKRNSSRSSASVIATSNVENVSQDGGRRASSRTKKVVKYMDEPFSSKEMKRILKKGRKGKK